MNHNEFKNLYKKMLQVESKQQLSESVAQQSQETKELVQLATGKTVISESSTNDIYKILQFMGESAVKEDEVEEGNEFSGELAKAKAAGKKEFEVDGKTYKVEEGAVNEDHLEEIGVNDIDDEECDNCGNPLHNGECPQCDADDEEDVNEASTVNGVEQKADDMVWKSTQMSKEEAIAKYGEENVKVGMFKRGTGEEDVQVRVRHGGSLGESQVNEGFDWLDADPEFIDWALDSGMSEDDYAELKDVIASDYDEAGQPQTFAQHNPDMMAQILQTYFSHLYPSLKHRYDAAFGESVNEAPEDYPNVVATKPGDGDYEKGYMYWDKETGELYKEHPGYERLSYDDFVKGRGEVQSGGDFAHMSDEELQDAIEDAMEQGDQGAAEEYYAELEKRGMGESAEVNDMRKLAGLSEAEGTAEKYKDRKGMMGDKYDAMTHSLHVNKDAQKKFIDRRHETRKAQAKTDPGGARKGLGSNVVDTDKAMAKAKKKGISRDDARKAINWTNTNSAAAKDKGRLPEDGDGGMDSGAVATGGSSEPKSLWGNPSVYESWNDAVNAEMAKLAESMNVTINSGDDQEPSMSVTATGEDAFMLSQLLQLSGQPQQAPCGAEDVDMNEELANEPAEKNYSMQYMLDRLSGGLNGPKKQVNPNNRGDNPLAMKGLDGTGVDLDNQ